MNVASEYRSAVLDLADRVRASNHLMPVGATLEEVLSGMGEESPGPNARLSLARNLGGLVAAHLMLVACDGAQGRPATPEVDSSSGSSSARQLAVELLEARAEGPPWLGEVNRARGIGINFNSYPDDVWERVNPAEPGEGRLVLRSLQSVGTIGGGCMRRGGSVGSAASRTSRTLARTPYRSRGLDAPGG